MKNKYNEEVEFRILSNGLSVYVVHKEGYVKSHAIFLTPFGALKNKVYDENNNVITFKSGLAHFLEHKMFELADGTDASDEFSKLGIQANAYTTYNETCYFFTTSFDLEKPLTMLLDFVQELNVTSESVEKEKGIIIQELRMYQQMADIRFVQELFSSMYEKHPLRYDVGGDEQSVNSVTVEDLIECYKMNYHPQNMVLVVVSGENPDKIFNIIENNQKEKHFEAQRKLYPYDYNESKDVYREHYTFKMDINQKRYGLGFKLEGIHDNVTRYREDAIIHILMEMYFSSSNTFIQNLLDERLINDSFVYDSEIGYDYGFLIFASETNDEKILQERLFEGIDSMLHDPLDEKIFASIKNRMIGNSIRLMNRFDDFATALAKSQFIGVDYFESIEILKNITLSDLERVRKSLVLDKKCDVLLESES